MFNSGAMLIDLDKWKKDKVEDKFFQFITKKKGQIQQSDQDALNAVLSLDYTVLKSGSTQLGF